MALIVRKQAVVHVSLCEEHRKHRALFILMGWLMVLAGFASFFVAVARENGLWALGGVAMLVAGDRPRDGQGHAPARRTH